MAVSDLSDSDQALIARYRGGVARIDAALAGATSAELDARVGGEWSARMVAHHMADSETNSYVRLRRLLADEPPATIAGYDEMAWSSTPQLGYGELAIDHSLAVFRAVRAASLDVLERISRDDLDRRGVHSESGDYSVRDWLSIYAAHAEDHAAQIEAARARGVTE